ncbi:hypothetical protein [Sunxiuqinia indica]|uniref:hypothetical protein n=1 Tax=Sunxiuqinia indica TaxID=2692584 RepID=UPI00135B8396|nr:hypothetical protein [Sunxiuqinia indica]
MRKCLKTILLGLLFLNSNGQHKPSLNIYEFGEPLTTCEMNFKNLFNNWNNDNITNADDFTLVNYSFVETITDTSSIELYSKLLTENKSLLGIVKNSLFSTSTVNTSSIVFAQSFSIKTFGSLCDTTNSSPSKATQIVNAFEQERERLKMAFKTFVKTGDKVFVVFFKDSGQIYTSFVVCSSTTKKVIWDNVFLNIKVKQ